MAPEAQNSLSIKLPPLTDSAASPVSQSRRGEIEGAQAGGWKTLWLYAALAVLGGVAGLWWFTRRQVLAGGPQSSQFTAAGPATRSPLPGAAPRPVPGPPEPRSPLPAAPVPAPEPSPLPIGIVSTRLRPTLDIRLNPLTCLVEADHVSIEFEFALYNSGNLPARSVLVEAILTNAGPSQDQEIAQFLAHPRGEGGRLEKIAPLSGTVVRTLLRMPRDQVREHVMEGRPVFIPVVAVNVLYSWSNGEGQTASAFLIGRETGRARLAPLRVDRGEGTYQSLGIRELEPAS